MSYRVITYGLVILCCLLQSCGQPNRIEWGVTLNEQDKNPYGAYLSYKSLKHFFPGVEIHTLSQGYRYDNIDARMKYRDGKVLMILTGLRFHISEKELNQLIDFARVGNEIVLFSNSPDSKLQKRLGFTKANYALTGSREEIPLMGGRTGKENLNSISLTSDSQTKYGYEGRTIQGYFWQDTSSHDISEEEIQEEPAKDDRYETADAEQVYAGNDHKEEVSKDVNTPAEILGKVKGEANILRYTIGKGHITLHAAPLVMSNYFLLQENNIAYLEGFWNYLPDDITYIYWNSYFNRRSEHSSFDILWKHPATRWALSLSIIALLLYVLLEAKRRQGALAIVKPLENTSVTFVETIGRLYYNKGNHYNLAEKMTQHFLEWVRSHYYLNTNHLDEIFVRNISAKSGLPIEVAKNLVEMIHEIRLGSIHVDEAYLYHLDNTIQRFYKNRNT